MAALGMSGSPSPFRLAWLCHHETPTSSQQELSTTRASRQNRSFQQQQLPCRGATSTAPNKGFSKKSNNSNNSNSHQPAPIGLNLLLGWVCGGVLASSRGVLGLRAFQRRWLRDGRKLLRRGVQNQRGFSLQSSSNNHNNKSNNNNDNNNNKTNNNECQPEEADPLMKHLTEGDDALMRRTREKMVSTVCNVVHQPGDVTLSNSLCCPVALFISYKICASQFLSTAAFLNEKHKILCAAQQISTATVMAEKNCSAETLLSRFVDNSMGLLIVASDMFLPHFVMRAGAPDTPQKKRKGFGKPSDAETPQVYDTEPQVVGQFGQTIAAYFTIFPGYDESRVKLLLPSGSHDLISVMSDRNAIFSLFDGSFPKLDDLISQEYSSIIVVLWPSVPPDASCWSLSQFQQSQALTPQADGTYANVYFVRGLPTRIDVDLGSISSLLAGFSSPAAQSNEVQRLISVCQVVNQIEEKCSEAWSRQWPAHCNGHLAALRRAKEEADRQDQKQRNVQQLREQVEEVVVFLDKERLISVFQRGRAQKVTLPADEEQSFSQTLDTLIGRAEAPLTDILTCQSAALSAVQSSLQGLLRRSALPGRNVWRVTAESYLAALEALDAIAAAEEAPHREFEALVATAETAVDRFEKSIQAASTTNNNSNNDNNKGDAKLPGGLRLCLHLRAGLDACKAVLPQKRADEQLRMMLASPPWGPEAACLGSISPADVEALQQASVQASPQVLQDVSLALEEAKAASSCLFALEEAMAGTDPNALAAKIKDAQSLGLRGLEIAQQQQKRLDQSL
ncbi:unnamed protein product, partial [Polarella glacialis]